MGVRPSWDDYFMGIAFITSLRSPDPDTKHGCVIVNNNRHILGTGYNGAVSGINLTPKMLKRPEKYLHLLHAEVNSLNNAPYDLRGCTTYVTGTSCYNCLMNLCQRGITKVIQAARQGSQIDDSELIENFLLKLQKPFEVKVIKPNLEFIHQWSLNQNSF